MSGPLARWLGAVLVAVLAAGGPSQSRADESGASTVDLIAPIGDHGITVRLYRPQGPGPVPLVILSHGSPADPAIRGRIGPGTLRRQALALVDDGFAVAVPLRRRYGGQGAWMEGTGSCEAPDFATGGRRTAEDIGAAFEVATRQPGIDAGRVVLIGHSAGGWGSLAAAAELPLRGVVNFAGGRASPCLGDPAARAKLVEAAGRLGREVRSPSLWIYSSNDRSFEPDLARAMLTRFTASGGVADLIVAPPYGRDGHVYVDDIASWHADVLHFLRRLGLP